MASTSGRMRSYKLNQQPSTISGEAQSVSSPRSASLAAASPRRAIFPPQGTDHGWRHAVLLLCRRLNPTRRRRANPRLIKRKMPKWHVKRARHHDWPQPTGPPTATIQRSN
jgi:hypothetical protein